MDFSSLIRTFNRLSLPKKVAASVAAIAGGVALISIPLLSLRPPSPPTVFNEDAYYKSRITDRGGAGGTTTPNQDTAIDTTTIPNLPEISGGSATIPELSSPLSGSNPQLDTAGTAIADIEANPSLNDPAGNAPGVNGRTNNSYSGAPAVSEYTSPTSLSNNPYKVSSPGGTSLNTPYSLPNSSIGAASAQPYGLQPGTGNTFADINPFDQNNPGSNTSPNAATAPGTGGTLPSRGAIAPSSLGGSSGDIAAPTAPNPGGDFTSPVTPNNPGGNLNLPNSATSPNGVGNNVGSNYNYNPGQ